MNTTQTAFDPAPLIARELSLPLPGVRATLALLQEGATVPFLARYRKERTGSLDEVQIRDIQSRHDYLTELESRRQTILEQIDSVGQLTPALRAKILAADTKTALEDLYLPFKPRRRTRATRARERGLEPLAQRILAQPPKGHPERETQAFVDPELEVPDVEAALAGARDIVAETVAERADVRADIRARLARGRLVSRAARGKAKERSKFEAYYEHDEPVRTVPSHRYLAMRRGEREGFLKIHIDIDEETALADILSRAGHLPRSPFASQLREAVADGYPRLILPSLTNDVRLDLKTRADAEAVGVFAQNLENLLLAAPLGQNPVIGIDPGQRTGCKCAVLDPTGKFLEHVTIYLDSGSHKRSEAERILTALVRKHQPAAIAVGNGTGGRETEAFVRKLLTSQKLPKTLVVSVNESGASVYSASDVAREEFPDLDLTIRGAISIGRRLQDPLAELVKLDPKVIGVGQYQHDVHQPLLADTLDAVVESCVNRVGVELNTASAPLLSRVAGVRSSVASNIVAHRESKGAFSSRKQLLDVKGLGPKSFEQCAGFLRVRGGAHPLDASAVHPERYALVERMARDLGSPLAQLVGNATLAASIEPAKYTGEGVGEPTLRDILDEIQKPGRDPREQFEAVQFRDDVHTPEDLEVGMRLQGVVTNVTHFGAFVDVGVHQDGLVHISQLADRFVKDPHTVVKVGDPISVRVLDIDLVRRRISLSARSEEDNAPRKAPPRSSDRPQRSSKQGRRKSKSSKSSRKPPKRDFSNNPFAGLLGDDG